MRRAGAQPPFESYPAIAIEAVTPEIDGGRWPVKRVVGDTIDVAADIFKEGHDVLRARVLYRAADEPTWHDAPMRQGDNDRWSGQFSVDRNTRYVYSIEAYTDWYGSWRADLQKRLAAAQDVTSELLEGVRLVEEAAERATDADDRGATTRVRQDVASAQRPRRRARSSRAGHFGRAGATSWTAGPTARMQRAIDASSS